MQQKSYTHITFYYQKLNKHIFFLIFIFFILNKTQGQQFNNWYFPINNGITFNTNPPSIITNSNIGTSVSSSASISDKNGNLLFYSNGTEVFDKNNNIMPNGTGLLGQNCQINGLLIVPFINDTSKYYVFTAQGLSNYTSGSQSSLPYSYSIVDMNQNGGLGDVVTKNSFIRYFSTEKMVAIPHTNGNDVWWICRDWTNNFYSYKITCAGIQNTNPIISSIGTNVNNDLQRLNSGDIKASLNGKFIAVAYGNYFEVYQFNQSTGQLSNPIKIPAECYGVEFSPNSNFLYVTCYFYPRDGYTTSIYQFDLSVYDSSSIYNNALRLISTTNNTTSGFLGGLQLGPDNKIYHVYLDKFIDRIEFPDMFGNNSILNEKIIFTPNFNTRRLPYSYVNVITAQNVQIPNYTVAPDCRTVTLTGKTYIKGNNLTFKWKFGDGDSTIQIVPSGGDTTFTSITHFYPPGIDTFNVQLFVTSDTICGQGSAGKNVIVKPPKPIANFGIAATCNNLLVNILDSSLLNFNPSISYQWQFLNKNNILLGSSTLQNTSFTFPAFDTFKTMLIASSALSCVAADTLIKTFVLKAKPSAAFSYSNNCGSLSAAFNNLSLVTADTLTSYFWNFGDGTVSVDKNPIHNFTAFGNYTVKLVVTSSLGCISDTFSLPVLIKAKPVANFIYNNNGCAGSPVLLQDSAFVTNSSIVNHYWLLPNGSSLNTVHINPSFSVGGNYLIKYVVSSAQGCISDTLAKSVLIESIPVAAIAAVSGGCVNTSLALSSISTIATGQINSFAWQVGNFTANTANPNFTFTNFGNYNISLVVTSNNGCVSNTASTAVTIQSNPVTAFSNTLVCINKPVDFTNNSNNIFGNIISSEWLINNTLVSTNNNGFNYTFNHSGNYVISLKNTTANGCSTSATKNILVEPALANAGRDTTVLENQPFVLQGSGGANYFWQPPIGLDNITKANPTGILNNNQQYILRATTAQGCIGFDTVVITVLRNLKIPNAFSPNGDGINETWGIEQLKDYPNAVVQIFNRNGQLMYTAKGNNITSWNGTINNQPVPVSTYYYIITLNNVLRNKPISGWVMVVR